jgi:hypothetical protein
LFIPRKEKRHSGLSLLHYKFDEFLTLDSVPEHIVRLTPADVVSLVSDHSNTFNDSLFRFVQIVHTITPFYKGACLLREKKRASDFSEALRF